MDEPLGDLLKRRYHLQASPAPSPPKSSGDSEKPTSGNDKPNKLKQYWALTTQQKQAMRWAKLDEMARRIDSKITVCSEDGWRQASCVDCRDLGWLGYDVEKDDPNFGKVRPCHCLARRQADRAISVLVGEEAVSAYTFAAFRTTWPWPHHNALAQEAKLAAVAWASNEGPPWLVLEGPPGSGKSHLALAALRERVAAGADCCYYGVSQYLDLLKAGMGSDEARVVADTARDRVLGSDALVLDDYGLQRNTDWAVEQMENFLGLRYQKSRRTLITTNSLEHTSDRIRSRIGDRERCLLVSMAGAQDVRSYLGRR